MRIMRKKRWVAAMLAAVLALTLAPAWGEDAGAPAEPAHTESAPSQPKDSASETEAPPAPKDTPVPEPKDTPEAQPTDVPEVTPTPEVQPTDEAPEVTATPEAEPTKDAEPTPDATASETPAVETPEPSAEPTEDSESSGFELRRRSKTWHNNHLDPDNLRIPRGGMPIPQLFQYHYTTTICTIDGASRTVATSGCGATAASMVIAYICKDYDQTPYTLLYEAVQNGWYHGDGLGYESLQSILLSHGVDARLLSVSREGIINALEKNRPVILKMGDGVFTDNGHYILLRGLDEEGRVLVNDPNSEGRSGDSYSLKRILRESKSSYMLVAYTPAEDDTEEAQPEPTPAPEATAAPEAAEAVDEADASMSVVVDATLAPQMAAPEDAPLK